MFRMVSFEYIFCVDRYSTLFGACRSDVELTSEVPGSFLGEFAIASGDGVFLKRIHDRQ